MTTVFIDNRSNILFFCRFEKLKKIVLTLFGDGGASYNSRGTL
jgi:hypothetical protein